MKKEIILPSGTKATMYQDGDKVVIEYEEKKWEPKIGEVVKNGEGTFFIYKGKDYSTNCAFFYAAYSNGRMFLREGDRCLGFGLRPTTPDERAIFFADLKKAGYKWDSKKMVLKKIEERLVPKAGDFVALTHTNNISGISLLCFSDMRKNGDYHCYYGLSNTGSFSLENTYFSECVTGVRLMADSEKQRLLDAMHKEGKDWDAVNKKVVGYVWRPKKGEEYYVACIYNNRLWEVDFWQEDADERRLFDNGLVFKTSEEAIARAKRMLNTK